MPGTEQAAAQVPAPSARYESYSHEALAAEVTRDNDPVAAGQVGARWQELARRFADSTAELDALVGTTHEKWRGQAGDAVREVLGTATRWLTEQATVSTALGESVAGQADVAARARAEMPPPVGFDPAAMIREAAASGNLAQLAGLSGAMAAQRARAEAARQKAVDVMNARDVALHGLVPRQGFAAPPSLGNPAKGPA
ncbi:PPE domain-containing protein [Amycolatopsis samaneae]|uniref:PPE domain-containing protein n=1 Tax=Amycolatopsis samaneae TaxID=664691 RepID=A0ABW5G6C4_9PSEU